MGRTCPLAVELAGPMICIDSHATAVRGDA
uniref:Uncharacterized protein n=1 Tax=Anguilla anguilla TaxID=7936 RepID=A0A0E9SWG2_ANGAN